jgi:hypothetical protein
MWKENKKFMFTAKAHKILGTGKASLSDYKYSVQIKQNSVSDVIVKDKEMAQRIAAALNFFDTVMSALSTQQFKEIKVNAEPDNFQRFAIGGSWVAAIGYDSKNYKLQIEKYNGSILTYLNVPLNVAQRLLVDNSVGNTYNKLIKGKYQTE